MTHDDYAAHDAIGLAECIARDETSAGELLEIALARLDAVEPVLNTVVTRMTVSARREADNAPRGTGCFAGVPFLVKDLLQDVAGVRATHGSRALKAANYRPPVDAEIVRRFRASGVNIFGKTNTPELGTKGVTEPSANGVTTNPWDITRSPGGSSGGSAAAVAAGVVPMAGANDGGGSIRIPAGYCGLFGLRPGRARVPGGPYVTDQAFGLSSDHVLTRSVRDSAAMLDATAGYERGAIARLAAPETTYRSAAASDPPTLRIALMDDSPLATFVHADARMAVNDTAEHLTGLGHIVERAEPAIDGGQLARDFLLTWYVRIGLALADIQRKTGCRWHDFELDTRAMAHVGRAFSAFDYADMEHRWLGYRQALADLHARYDLLLTPTQATPPVAIGALDTPPALRAMLGTLIRLPSARALVASGLVDRLARASLAHVPFTQLANLTGTPAMSVPLYWNTAGLPLGSQFVGPPGGETRLFQLAGQLEHAVPWFDRRPRLVGIDPPSR